MGIVKSTRINELGEVVSAKIMKGNRQVVNKHVNDLILLLRGQPLREAVSDSDDEQSDTRITRIQPSRKSKEKANQRLAEYDDL